MVILHPLNLEVSEYKTYLSQLIMWLRFKKSMHCIWSAQWANDLLHTPKFSLYICFICRVYRFIDSSTDISLLCGGVWDIIYSPQLLSTWAGHQPRNTTMPEYWNRHDSWKMQRVSNIWCNTEHVLPGQSSEWWVIWCFIVLCIRNKVGHIPQFTELGFSITPFKRQKFVTVRDLMEIGFEDEFLSIWPSAACGWYNMDLCDWYLLKGRSCKKY